MSTTRQLLDVWEALRGASPARRAIELATVGRSDADAVVIAGWSVGARDEALMELRSALFGPAADAVGECAECGEPIEFDIDVEELRSFGGEPGGETVVETDDGWVVASRPPTAADLVAIERAEGTEAAIESLWERCVLTASHSGQVVPARALPEAVRTAVTERWAVIDPLADVRLELVCPACEAPSQQAFDIASYVWEEVDGWARGLLADIHVIARAYGWSEDAILELSPTRRRWYLEMIAA